MSEDFKYQLLQFAKDLVWERYSSERQKADSEFSMLENAWRDGRIKEMPSYKVPSIPTANEIVTLAEAFEKYCNGKKSK